MSLSFITALMALLPPGLLRKKTESEIERLREDERRDRELSNAHANAAHWKDEAKRLARTNRVDREHYERILQREREAWAIERQQLLERVRQPVREQQEAIRLQAQLLAGHMRGQELLQAQAQAQQAQAQQNQALQHQQYAALGQQNLFQNGFEGFCNCVPGRAQVWSAEYQPAPADQRIARHRP